MKSWISPLTWARLVQIGKKYGDDPKKPPDQGDVVKIDVTARDKDERQKIHQQVRGFWPHLVTTTEGVQDKKFITVCYKKRKENSTEFPRERKENVLHFTLFKENWETNQLFGALYKQLRIRHTQNYSFKIAGTKDKRGRTAQRVSIK